MHEEKNEMYIDKKFKQKKKKPQIGLWIIVSICFLIFIGGLSMYLCQGNDSSASTADNSKTGTFNVTLTKVGFDTPVTFQATCTEAEYVQYLDIVKTTFESYNQIFDQYHDYDGVNNIKTLNEKAATESIKVDPLIIECIQYGMNIHKTHPKLDITQGKLLNLWHTVRESDSPVLPNAQDIQAALQHTGVEGIQINGNSISFSDSSIQLDLGAIAKGFTAQKCKEKLLDAGLSSGYINAGGNVVLIGTKKDGKDWNIGITQPDANQSLVQFITPTPTCLVTSGDYQRYVEIEGTRYSHIIDPSTGYPASAVRSVTVVNEDSTYADAMSTALFCMDVKDGLEVCRQEGLSAVWFVNQGSSDLQPKLSANGFDIYYTDDLEGKIQLSSSVTPQ